MRHQTRPSPEQILFRFSPALAKMGIIIAVTLAALVLINMTAAGGRKGCDLVFVGDSITAGGAWPRMFPQCRTVNQGVPGDSISDILARVGKTIELQPGQIFIMAGINDLWRGADPETVSARFRDLLIRVREGCPESKIYVQSVLPVNSKLFGGPIQNRDIQELNLRLQQDARQLGLDYLDIGRVFRTAGGNLDEAFTWDGIHLNQNAYRIWKNALIPHID